MTNFLKAIRLYLIPNTRPRLTNTRKQLSITSRGKSIQLIDLFNYTNGHFLIHEEYQLSRRYVRFNVPELCSVVSSIAGNDNSPVCHIDKMEGGFNKALLMKLENGKEVIVKIPCAIAGPPVRSTASEVAVVEYVRSHTTVPVPKVLAWCSNATNPVGVEYIIMEKSEGVQLFNLWEDMNRPQRLGFIENLTKLEAQMSAIHFPAYGDLYFRESVPAKSCAILDSSLDPAGLYCIGPAADRPWYDEERAFQTHPANLGPWSSLQNHGAAFADRSVWRSSLREAPIPTRKPPHHGNCHDHESLLNIAQIMLADVSSLPILQRSSQPVLWHKDLHMGNIFVSEKDPTEIVGLIDWQSTTIAPLFLQARFPIFLEPPEGYQRGLHLPKLPENFEELDADDKDIATEENVRALNSKAYEVSTCRQNDDTFVALRVPPALRELFLRCGDTADHGIVPLRECLVDLCRDWERLGTGTECPYVFTDEEISTHAQELADHNEWYEVQDLVRKALQTDDDGWISPEVDWEAKKARNKALFEMFVEIKASTMSREKALGLWPFPV